MSDEHDDRIDHGDRADGADATEWADDAPSGWSPDEYLGAGFLLLVVGAVLLGYNADSDMGPGQVIGLILSVVGAVVLGIGVVGKGVQVGRRHP